MKLSELIKKLQLELEANGDVDHVGLSICVGTMIKHRLDGFGKIDLLRSEGEYVESVLFLIAEHENYGLFLKDEPEKIHV